MKAENDRWKVDCLDKKLENLWKKLSMDHSEAQALLLQFKWTEF